MKLSKDWRDLLILCREHGKDRVLETLARLHRAYEWAEAEAWSDPDRHRQARKLQAICLQQDETMIRLRQMDDAEIARLLDEATP